MESGWFAHAWRHDATLFSIERSGHLVAIVKFTLKSIVWECLLVLVLEKLPLQGVRG